MMSFKPGVVPPSRDLSEMKSRIGGQSGVIRIGGESLEALKLANNLFVTDKNVPPLFKKIASLMKSDIHSVQSRGDMVFFNRRYRDFRRKDG